MTETTFAESSKIQFNVVKALILRDMVGRYGDSRLGFLWSMFRPAIVLVVLYAAAKLSHHAEVQGMPVLVFLICGYYCWLSFEWSYLAVAHAPQHARGLLMFPHITLLDIIISQAIVEWGVFTVTFISLAGIGMLIEHDPFPADPLRVLVFLWTCTWLGSAVGVSIIVIRRFFPSIDNLTMPLRRVGVMISGVVLPAALIPPNTLGYFSWNPLYRAIEIMRQSWYPAYQSPIATPSYVLTVFFFAAVIALVLERATRSMEER